MDDSFRIDEGMARARALADAARRTGAAHRLGGAGPDLPQCFGELISWSADRTARTGEWQTRGEMASRQLLGRTVGFKNGTDGGLEVAMNAIRVGGVAARHSWA